MWVHYISAPMPVESGAWQQESSQPLFILSFETITEFRTRLCVRGSVCPGTNRGQKRMLDPLELELQEVMSCLTWVLETELWPSVRATSALSH